MNFKITLLISIILHLIVIHIKIQENKPKEIKRQNQDTTTIKVEIQENDKSDKPSNEELYVMNELEEFFNVLKKADDITKKVFTKEYIDDDCKTFYVGIGIRHDSVFNEIDEIVENGPAHRAGLLKGDAMLDPNFKIRDVYPIGTLVNIGIIRNGTIMIIPIRVNKICTTED